MTTCLCASVLTHTDGCSCTYVHFPAAHAFVHVSVSTHSHTHMVTYTGTHTHVAQQPVMATMHTFSSLGKDNEGTTPRPLGPMLCDVPQFPLLAQPSTHTPPALLGPCVAGTSRAGWSLAKPRGWHRRHFPEPSTSNCQLIRQPNTTALPVPQPNHPSWGQLPLWEAAQSPVFSQPLQPASWQNLATVRAKASRGTETLLGYPLIWDMPAWPHCSEHPRVSPPILAVPLPAHATHDTGSPTPERRHRSTAPHTMFPASCCPHTGLGDSVSPLSKGRYSPAALGRHFWCREGGRGKLCVSHTYQCPSIQTTPLTEREGGLLSKEKIPEQRHRAQDGPYMGMGTVLCFPADECAAALAPPQPPTGTRHPTSITASTGQ